MVARLLVLAWAASTAPAFHAELRDYLEGVGGRDGAKLAFAQSYGALMDKQSLRDWLQYYNMPATASDLGPTYRQMDVDANGLSFAELVAEMELREQVITELGLKRYTCWHENFPFVFLSNDSTVQVGGRELREATMLINAYERYVEQSDRMKLDKNDMFVLNSKNGRQLRDIDYSVLQLKRQVDRLCTMSDIKPNMMVIVVESNDEEGSLRMHGKIGTVKRKSSKEGNWMVAFKDIVQTGAPKLFDIPATKLEAKTKEIARQLAMLIRLVAIGVKEARTSTVLGRPTTPASSAWDNNQWSTQVDLKMGDWETTFLDWWCSSNFQQVFHEAPQGHGDMGKLSTEYMVKKDKACAAMAAKKAPAATKQLTKEEEAEQSKKEFDGAKPGSTCTVKVTVKAGISGTPTLGFKWKNKGDTLPADIGIITRTNTGEGQADQWTTTKWFEGRDDAAVLASTVDPKSPLLESKVYRIIEANDQAIPEADGQDAFKNWKKTIEVGKIVTLKIKIVDP